MYKMVLSTTKKTSRIASITNANQGGGEKKSGLPKQVGKDSWANMFINASQTKPGRSAVKTVVTYRMVTRPVGLRSGSAFGFSDVRK